jgi:hypothetical protein
MGSIDPSWRLSQWIRQLRAELPLGLVIANVAARMNKLDGDDRYDLALDLKAC